MVGQHHRLFDTESPHLETKFRGHTKPELDARSIHRKRSFQCLRHPVSPIDCSPNHTRGWSSALKYAPTRHSYRQVVNQYRKELSVDLYELTMSQVFWRRGMDSSATFSLFFRGYPKDRAYYIASGIDDALDFLEDFHFSADEIRAIRNVTPLSDEFVDFLTDFSFSGTVRAVPEGSIVFAAEPLIEVTGTLIETQIVETMLLNIVTTASLLATKAARIVQAADGRPVVDFGSRRTHGEDAAIEAARASYISGFAGTSNVKAAALHGIPAYGTMAHSFIQAFDNEVTAFAPYADEFPETTTFLVDTYDTLDGVRNAIRVAEQARSRGTNVNAIRLDSGDLAELARAARALMDEAGFPQIRIMASGGLDEHSISQLVASCAPIDAFGVGTRFGTSADAPYIDSVYKLVEIDGRPVIKLSTSKVTKPWAKQVFRRFEDGMMRGDVITRSTS
ncbi:MAG: nicotinate phosphoribosyltransferase, partial [Chloroflexi bacterium]|nr:nicotinate phosphoribosyltransferase [Chloroflexota bacterium]